MGQSAGQGFSRIRARVGAGSRRLRDLIRRWLDWLEPSPARSFWIGRVVFIGALALGGWIGAESLNLPFGLLGNIGFGVLMAWLFFGLAQLLVGPGLGLLQLIKRLWTPRGLIGILAIIGLLNLIALPPQLAIPAGLVIVLALVLVGAGLSFLQISPQRPWAGLLCLLPATLVLVMGLVWMLGDERSEDPVRFLVTAPQGDGQPWDAYLQRGPYQTGFLTYGSGTDRWRKDYANRADWQSSAVDARDLLGRPSGFGLKLRERWWGFGLDALPLNGRVWYPLDAAGRLPLVLVVHGNHDMMHYSDPGYAWLGEHLASRGHIVVSVDQNFINSGLFGSVPRENGVRGWLLLQHLAAWRQWQSEPEHQVHEQADLGQVVLVGHSRGGEAAALAAVFNRLQRYPEDGRIEFDFDFGIQGVAAIAPIDGQFWTSGKPTELAEVSYFVVQGGMDADVYYFAGDRQLARTRPDPAAGRFSASLYVHHANHGQFNTVWGDNDTGMIAGRLLNRAWLVSGEAQRRVGLLYLTAFVENALDRPTEIPALFCDPAAAGALLPETLYVARCDNGRRVVLADFEQGLDLTQGTLRGVALQARDLDLWSERDVGFRGNPQRRQTGVFLGWHAAREGADSAADPGYLVHLGPELHERLQISAGSMLWLDLAHIDRDPPPRAESADDDEAADRAPADEREDDALRPRLAITIVLQDADGRQSSISLSEFADLLPPLPVRHTRLGLINRKRYHSATEPVLQSVAIPLAGFAADGLALEQLQTIELQFANQHSGALIIERISIEPAD